METDEKINILYVQHELMRAGSSISLHTLVSNIDRNRFNPVIVCARVNDAIGALYRELGIEVITANIGSFIHIRGTARGLKGLFRALRFLMLFPHAYVSLKKIMLSRNISIVHINTLAAPVAALAARAVSVPVIWHVREVIDTGYLGVRKKLIECAMNACADRIIAISNDEAGMLHTGKQISIVNNAVDFSSFDRQLTGESFRKEFGLTGTCLCVGTISSLDPMKGVYDFIQAAGIIRQKCDNVHFFIVGGQISESRSAWVNAILKSTGLDEDHAMKIEEMISDRGLDGCVHITGERADIPSVIAAMDLVVCPYRLFAIGRPAIEAAAMAKPAVAASTNPDNGIVADRVTGHLFPPGDYQKLADAAVQILSDREEAKRMGERAYAYAREHFDAVPQAQAVTDIYEEVLSKTGRL